MEKNRSMAYLLPLIGGWSAKADYPINSYAMSNNYLLVLYDKNGAQHDDGILAWENEQYICFSHIFRPTFRDDAELIRAGKYSLISDRAKSLILSRSEEEDYDFIEGVLHKSKALRSKIESKLGIKDIDRYTDEYDSKFLDEEIFNPDKL